MQGAMKFAWTNRFQAQRPDLSMTFFGAPALAMRNLVREGEFIVPTDDDVREMLTYTSGGEDRIDIRKYDVFLIVALGFNMDMVDVMPHGVIAEQLELGPAERAISHACFDTIVRAPLETSPAMRLARDIRFVSTRPIYVCLRPFASEIIFKGRRIPPRPAVGRPSLYRRDCGADKARGDECCAEKRLRIDLAGSINHPDTGLHQCGIRAIPDAFADQDARNGAEPQSRK
ncbi:MAG: hypothetical protein WDM89_12045 [Rhizomicrobium sp.]